MMLSLSSFKTLEISNACVLVCGLTNWTNDDSACWMSLKGTQAEIGSTLARLFDQFPISRIDDFGGVCKTFLCRGDEYLLDPPKTKPGAAIFSFTPKKRVEAEGLEMARVAHVSGYHYLVLTLQKHGKFGKVWVLSAALDKMQSGIPTYYEDTSTVIDELKVSNVGTKVIAVHVQSPGFEEFVSTHANRVITQETYQKEVLLP